MSPDRLHMRGVLAICLSRDFTILTWQWAFLQIYHCACIERSDMSMKPWPKVFQQARSVRWEIYVSRNVPVLNAVGWLASFSSDSDERATATKRNFHRQNAISFCCRIRNSQPIVTRIANLQNICTYQLLRPARHCILSLNPFSKWYRNF